MFEEFDIGGDSDPYGVLGYGATVPVDVSDGAPAMQTSTPTGAGSGVFVDQSTQNQIFGTLNNVLNYALKRDQMKMTAVAQAPMQQAQAQVQYQQVKNNNLLLWLAIGAGVIMLVRE